MDAHKNHDKVHANPAPAKPDVKVGEVMVSAQHAERLASEAAKQAAWDKKRADKAAHEAALKNAHNAQVAPEKPVAKG